MGLRDIRNGTSVVTSLAPALRAATANGAAVDTKGFDSAVAVVDVGAGTDGQFTFTLEDSPNASDWTAVVAAELDGAFTVVDAEVSPDTGVNTISRVGYKGGERYLRVVATESSGTSPAPATGITFGAQIILGHPHQSPVA